MENTSSLNGLKQKIKEASSPSLRAHVRVAPLLMVCAVWVTAVFQANAQQPSGAYQPTPEELAELYGAPTKKDRGPIDRSRGKSSRLGPVCKKGSGSLGGVLVKDADCVCPVGQGFVKILLDGVGINKRSYEVCCKTGDRAALSAGRIQCVKDPLDAGPGEDGSRDAGAQRSRTSGGAAPSADVAR